MLVHSRFGCSAVLLVAFVSSGCSTLPSANSTPINSWGRFWGIGFSDGYHECNQHRDRLREDLMYKQRERLLQQFQVTPCNQNFCTPASAWIGSAAMYSGQPCCAVPSNTDPTQLSSPSSVAMPPSFNASPTTPSVPAPKKQATPEPATESKPQESDQTAEEQSGVDNQKVEDSRKSSRRSMPDTKSKDSEELVPALPSSPSDRKSESDELLLPPKDSKSDSANDLLLDSAADTDLLGFGGPVVNIPSSAGMSSQFDKPFVYSYQLNQALRRGSASQSVSKPLNRYLQR